MPSPHSPIAFYLGPLGIRWYAIFILTGIVLAIALIRWLAAKRGFDPEFLLDIAVWVVIFAIVGARAYYILLKPIYYFHHPFLAIDTRSGGMTIHGAIAGGLITVWWLCRRHGQPLLPWLDMIVPGVAIGQAIGRWGNWANQEAFGTPSTLPWAVHIDPARRPAAYIQYATFHPTFLYESLIDLATAAFLIWLVLRLPKSSVLRDGDVAWIYFIIYGVARFFIERIRTDSLYIGPLPAAYWLSFALVIIGVTMLTIRRTLWTSLPAHASPPPIAPRAESAVPSEAGR